MVDAAVGASGGGISLTPLVPFVDGSSIAVFKAIVKVEQATD